MPDVWPASVVYKRLVQASSCAVHPKYQGRRKPVSKAPGCTCFLIWSAIQAYEKR